MVLANFELSSGITVETPNGVNVVGGQKAFSGKRNLARKKPNDIYNYIRDDNLEHLETFKINVNEKSQNSIKKRSFGSEDVKLKIPYKHGSSVVLLVESDGFFQWVRPEETPHKRNTSQSHYFSLSVSAEDDPKTSRALAKRRGIVKWAWRHVFKKAVVYVFRFVAIKIIDKKVKKIDGNGPFGLFEIKGDNPENWMPSVSDTNINLSGKKKRVLLMVHGTFSTTRNSFGVMAKKNSSKFYDKLHEKYDVVLGFDHKTLAESAVENSQNIFKALKKISTNGEIITVDAIGYSRGGLVLRHFIEKELPKLSKKFKAGNIVYVGSTLAGTELANYENWDAFLTHYTNLIAGATRTFGYFLSAQFITEPAAAIVNALGGFAKVFVQEGVKAENVPGIAAMVPNSPIVKSLQDSNYPEAQFYHAIGSNYEPNKSKKKKLSSRFVKMLAIDKVADKIFPGANDLVVHTGSMTSLDSDTAIQGNTYIYSEKESVYHTIYFGQKKTVEKLNRWLL